MLPEIVFRSEDLPVRDRFDAWRERMRNTHAPTLMTSEHAADFFGHQRVLQLGPASVWPATFQPMVFRRTPKMIRESDPEVCHLSLPLQGTLGIVRDGHESRFGPYEMHPNDSSLASDMLTAADGRVIGIGLEVPKALIPLPRRDVNRVIGQCISGRDGVGALLAGFLTRLSEDAGSYRAADAPRLGTVLIDMMAAVFAHALDAETALPPETYQRSLTLRVKDFIRQNLHDPDLTPTRVAAAHHISISYLHRLFTTETTTVAAYIRQHRLEGARRDLAAPALSATPIHAVAVRWGFPRAADFTRAFRTAYGLPPSEYRSRSRAEGAAECGQDGGRSGGDAEPRARS
ncbi:AraC family transcriptional regulator [Streptomyces sp. NPDC093707]|uniref:AraC family transcriptional regulator n=1 Tax=Streptomyces sp. NPDC093707 TaxID=3154984 RepID=UPI00344D69B8